MKRVRKLGRGLEDFSHLFLSSPIEKHVPPVSTTPELSSEAEHQMMNPRVLCISGGGKAGERAFFIVNLALEFVRQGKRVLMFDADFSLPRLCMLINVSAHHSFLHSITSNGTGKVTTDREEGIELITLDADISELSLLREEEREVLINDVRGAEKKADIILVHASSRCIPPASVILKACEEVIVVTPQPVAEMINAYGVVKLIFQVNRNARVGVVVTGVSTSVEGSDVFEKMQRVVQKFLNKPLVYYGFIPEEGVRSLSPHPAQNLADISRAISHYGEEEPLSRDRYCKSFVEKLFEVAG